MEAFVWLGAGRTDSTGSVWPEAGEVRAEACAIPGFQLLVGGVDDELWEVEFEGEPRLGPDGLEGRARLVASLSGWSQALAGALRLQLFELARGTLARALVSVDSPEWPNALSRDVMLDASQVGRKVATSRAPVELKQTLEKVKPIVSELWPPQKKRGLFGNKLDATRVYELLRKALESSIASTEEITVAVSSPELIASLNEQIAAVSRLAKADLMFGAMLRAAAAPNQEALEAVVEDARDKTRRLREIESGSGGHAGLTGGFSFTATDGFRSADRDRSDQASLELPEPIRTLTSWLGDRLDIDVAEIDLHRLERVGAVAASSGGSAAPPESTPDAESEMQADSADAVPDPATDTPAAPAAVPVADQVSARQASSEPTIEILPPGSLPEAVQEALPERNGKPKGPIGRPAAAAELPQPEIEPTAEPRAAFEAEPEVPSLAAAAAEAAESVGEPASAEPTAEVPEEEKAKPRGKPEPLANPRPAAKKPEPKPAPQREVVVVPNSPAGLEMAAPGPTEPSAPERAAAAASAASAKQSSSRSYPPPLAAHTHDSPIWGHDDLLRHVEIIHGVPVGNMEPDALQTIHDATHSGD